MDFQRSNHWHLRRHLRPDDALQTARHRLEDLICASLLIEGRSALLRCCHHLGLQCVWRTCTRCTLPVGRRWHTGLALRGERQNLWVVPSLVKEVRQLYVDARIMITVWPAAETIAHQAHIVPLFLAIRDHLRSIRDFVRLKPQPQRQTGGQPRVMTTQCGSTNQPQRTFVRDTVVGDVDAVHGESLWLCVQVLDDRVHDGIVQHVAIRLHDHTRYSEIAQDSEELVEPLRANVIVREIHVGTRLTHVGEVADHNWHLFLQPVTKLFEHIVLHWRVQVLQLNMNLPVPDDQNSFIPRPLLPLWHTQVSVPRHVDVDGVRRVLSLLLRRSVFIWRNRNHIDVNQV
mmetsp:Transcript_27674/g.72989  ORF Transcript_27674/g.72989 Transcript_27674/m.72989 type:complete len:344 (-) Transcript_27674:1149-2180(-)